MKDTGVVRWEFTGDVKLAQSYSGFARKLLGQLDAQNTLRLQDQRLHSSAPGVSIDVGISFGQRWARIHAITGGGEYWRGVCKGFIVDNPYATVDVLCWAPEEAEWYGPDLDKFTLGLTGYGTRNQVEKVVEYRTAGRVMKCCLSFGGRRYYAPAATYTAIYIDGRLLTAAPIVDGASSASIYGVTVVDNRLLVIMRAEISGVATYKLYHTRFKLEYKDNFATWELGAADYPEELKDYFFAQPILFSDAGTAGVCLVYKKEQLYYPYTYKTRVLRITASAAAITATLSKCDVLDSIYTNNHSLSQDSYQNDPVRGTTSIPWACYTAEDIVNEEGEWSGDNGTSAAGSTTAFKNYANKYHFVFDFDDNTEVFAYSGDVQESANGSCSSNNDTTYTGTTTFNWGTETCWNPPYPTIDIVTSILDDVVYSTTQNREESEYGESIQTAYFGNLQLVTYESSGSNVYSRNASSVEHSWREWIHNTTLDAGSEILSSSSYWDQTTYVEVTRRYPIDYDLRFGGMVLYVEHRYTMQHVFTNSFTPVETYTSVVQLKLKTADSITTLETYEFPSWTPTSMDGSIFFATGECSATSNYSQTWEDDDPTNGLFSVFNYARPGLTQSSLMLAEMYSEKDIYGHVLLSFKAEVKERNDLGYSTIETPYTELDGYSGNPVTELSEYTGNYATWYPYIHVLGEGYLPPSKARSEF